MKDKVLNYLGLAARGRLLVSGYNTCVFMIDKRKVRLLVIAEDLSEIAERKNVPYRIYGSMRELSHMTGKTDSGIFGVTDENLAKVISEKIDHRES